MKRNKNLTCLGFVLLLAAANAIEIKITIDGIPSDTATINSSHINKSQPGVNVKIGKPRPKNEGVTVESEDSNIISPIEEVPASINEDPPKVNDFDLNAGEVQSNDITDILNINGEEELSNVVEEQTEVNELVPPADYETSKVEEDENPFYVNVNAPEVEDQPFYENVKPPKEEDESSYESIKPPQEVYPPFDNSIVQPSNNINSNSSRPNKPHNNGHKRPRCRRRYGYIKIEGQCDAYVECKNYRPRTKLCPEGMNFNEKARWSEYPCGYPIDVPCRGRNIQKLKSTPDCPHQNGFFPVSSDDVQKKCSQYVVCSAGEPHLMKCPVSLVFNPAIGRCDWPEQVPDCKEFFGFKCPREENYNLDLGTVNYKHASKCSFFWSCLRGQSRLLRCDYGMIFDPNQGRCVVDELGKCNDYDVTPTPEQVEEQ